MSIEIKVPELPESITEATLVNWHKKAGEAVARDENLVDLETDKVVLEVPAPADGVLKEIKAEDGATVTSGQLIAVLDEGAAADEKGGEEEDDEPEENGEAETAKEQSERAEGERQEQGDKKKPARTEKDDEQREQKREEDEGAESEEKRVHDKEAAKAKPLSPSVRRLVEEHALDPERIPASGRDGRLTKSDVLGYLERGPGEKQAPREEKETAKPSPASRPVAGAREERRVPMSRIRARIAERMLESQSTTAMLTSFNEVDLGAVMEIRKRYREGFEKKHGVRLGYLSFFAKASVRALQSHPVVNASIEGGDIVYHDYWDIGIAVSSERGLVVPVIRDADQLSFAGIESKVIEYATKAREGGLALEDITGGTFTITNGGVFGSLLSTPIINPPQSAILGIHKIQERPMAVDGEVKIRPMMYIAITYDHRIVDGREAVLFLVAVKEALEDPARLLIDL